MSPLYEYYCECGYRFEEFHSIDDRYNSSCPVCEKPANLMVSHSNFRFAEPLTVYQDLGGRGNRHKGYQEVDWKPDSGICPKPGQPYKTDKDLAKEEHGGIKEV